MAFVLTLLSLLSPITNSSNPCYGKCPSSRVCDGPEDVVSVSDAPGASCFTALAVYGY